MTVSLLGPRLCKVYQSFWNDIICRVSTKPWTFLRNLNFVRAIFTFWTGANIVWWLLITSVKCIHISYKNAILDKTRLQSIVHHRKYPLFHFWTWPLGHGYTNVARYPPHHVTYAPVKFEVATSNGLGDELTRKNIIWPLTLTLVTRSHEMLPSTLYFMWPIQVQSLKLLRLTFRRRCIWNKYI